MRMVSQFSTCRPLRPLVCGSA